MAKVLLNGIYLIQFLARIRIIGISEYSCLEKLEIRWHIIEMILCMNTNGKLLKGTVKRF